MRISERQLGDAVVLDVAGPIAGRKAAAMIDASARRLCGDGTRVVVANLRDVSAIDLAGLGALIEAYITMREAGGVFRLACMSQRLHDLIAIARLPSVIETFESVDDAVGRRRSSFRGTAAAAPFSMMSLGPIQRFLSRA